MIFYWYVYTRAADPTMVREVPSCPVIIIMIISKGASSRTREKELNLTTLVVLVSLLLIYICLCCISIHPSTTIGCLSAALSLVARLLLYPFWKCHHQRSLSLFGLIPIDRESQQTSLVWYILRTFWYSCCAFGPAHRLARSAAADNIGLERKKKVLYI